MRIIDRSVVLPISADKALDLVLKPETLAFVSQGIIRFGEEENFPDIWEEGGTYQSELFLFGFLPLGVHEFTFVEIDMNARVLKTNEAGGLVTRWDHDMIIEPVDKNSCRYIDRVKLEAGYLTRPVWHFANLLYRHRQKRWPLLIEEEACKANVL